MREAPTNNIFEVLSEEGQRKLKHYREESKEDATEGKKSKNKKEHVPVGSQKKLSKQQGKNQSGAQQSSNKSGGGGSTQGGPSQAAQTTGGTSHQNTSFQNTSFNNNYKPKDKQTKGDRQAQNAGQGSGGWYNENKPPRQQRNRGGPNQPQSPTPDDKKGDNVRGPRSQKFRETKPRRGRQNDRRSGSGRDPTEVKKGGSGNYNWGPSFTPEETERDTTWGGETETKVTTADDSEQTWSTPAEGEEKEKKEGIEEKPADPEWEGEKEEDDNEKEVEELLLEDHLQLQQRKKEELNKLLEQANAGKTQTPAIEPIEPVDWSKFTQLAPKNERVTDPQSKSSNQLQEDTTKKKGDSRKGTRTLAVDEVFNVRLPPKPRRGRGGPRGRKGDFGTGDASPSEQQQRGGGSNRRGQGRRGGGRGGAPVGPRRNKQNRSSGFDATDPNLFPALNEADTKQ